MHTERLKFILGFIIIIQDLTTLTWVKELTARQTTKIKILNVQKKRKIAAQKIKRNAYKPCTRSRQDIGPLIWIEKFSFEHRTKIHVREPRTIVFVHEIDVFLNVFSFPIPPKPLRQLRGETRNRIHSPMHENPKLCFIKPCWDWSRVKRFPSWLVSRSFCVK